jgi:hypothetical protein
LLKARLLMTSKAEKRKTAWQVMACQAVRVTSLQSVDQ